MLTLEDRPIARVREQRPAISVTLEIPREELANAFTHGIGLVLSIAGGIALIARASSHVDAWRVAGCSVFAVTLIGMYAASTLSHCFSESRHRRLTRSLDQASIYLLIVGTYTAFGLSYLRTEAWLLMLGVMWIVALYLCVSKVVLMRRVEKVRVWSYLFLAWPAIAASPWMLELVPAAAFWSMFAGGVCYTAGTLFLAHDDRHRYFHATWHVFVMVASACHYATIFWFVAS
jgi:hemolysin III